MFLLGFQAGRIASLSGSVLNLLVILMLSRVYTMLAHILTRWGESLFHQTLIVHMKGYCSL